MNRIDRDFVRGTRLRADTVSEVVFDFLRRQGMTRIFGNPGSTEIPLFVNLPDDFSYVLGLQEASVVFMADACAQITGPVSSTYRWQGAVETAPEWYCHLKTVRGRLPALQARVRELHPYEVPEIIAIPIVDGDEAYLRWIEDSVS